MLGRKGYILGINFAYHQPSACLVKEGYVIAAVEEERFNRHKGGKETHVDNTLILPFASIDYVLKAGGIGIDQVSVIGTSFSPKRRRAFRHIWAKHPPLLSGEYETPEGDAEFCRLLNLAPQVLAGRFGLNPQKTALHFKAVPHHVAHIASSYYASPFETAAAVCLDGIGELESACIANCDGADINILEKVDYPHSLGLVWEVITNYLGFKGNHDESKVMGLAAYGDPAAHRKAMGEIIQVLGEGRFTTKLDEGVLRHDYAVMEKLFSVPRRLPQEPLSWNDGKNDHANIAAALQEKTNEIFLNLAARARERTGRKHLVMAGGCTLNCVANGIVAEKSGFEDLYVQPAAGDAGTSVGAALYLEYQLNKREKRQVFGMPTAFVGPSYTDQEIAQALKKHHLQGAKIADPVLAAVDLLAEGKIIGWFQGRMEFGPRALGNRSLLANPMLADIRETLNVKVKHREEFRPFCPAILAEEAAAWVEHEKPLCFASRYMLATYKLRAEKRGTVPAVIHLDGSARIQNLHRDDNPLYHDLLQAFFRRTGIPMLLNTSFNDSEPIVCSPDDACQCFLKTKIDAMIIGDYLVVHAAR